MTRGLSLTFLAVLLSCSSSYKYEYWDVSKFNMVSSALADNEEVKLIYSSQAPDDNEDIGYYIQVVVVSQKSGDTINVLTTINNGFDKEDGERIFNYLGPENPMTKIAGMDLDKLKDGINLNEKVNQAQLKRIDKVARDPEFDYIADNNYPTVIGTIGIVNKKDNE